MMAMINSLFGKKIKSLVIPCLLILTVLIACRSIQNEGRTDWANVEFSIGGSKQNIAFYSAAASSVETASFITVPEQLNSLSVNG